MSFTYTMAKKLAEHLKTQGKKELSLSEMSVVLRDITNTMDARWIKNFMQSMATAGLIELQSNGSFKVV